jgi:guanosine-3',5'-bis(diphosphate) 3'-pyrophosphohydrolase
MQNKLSEMIMLAASMHDGQFDKAGKPYILHCLTVLHFVQKLHAEDEELLCIALGHDLIEDTEVTFERLVVDFGARVAVGILALTKVKGESLEAYKARVMSNKDAIIVKMADLRHNSDIRRLKGVTEKDITRTAKYHQFYQELKACL